MSASKTRRLKLGKGGVETHPLTRRLPSRRGWVGLLTVRSLGDESWRNTLRHDRSTRAVCHARVCAGPVRTFQSKKDRHVSLPEFDLSRKEDKTAPLRAKNDWRLAGSRSSRTRAAPVDGPDDEIEDGEDNEADDDGDGDGNVEVVQVWRRSVKCQEVVVRNKEEGKVRTPALGPSESTAVRARSVAAPSLTPAARRAVRESRLQGLLKGRSGSTSQR